MTDGNTLNSGFYVDDIFPVCLFADVNTVSSSITDTSYSFTGHAEGAFYYYVKGYNNAWAWGDYSCLARADVVVGIAETPIVQDIINSSLVLTSNPGVKSITVNYAISQGVRDAYIKIYDAVGKLVRSYDVSAEPHSVHHRIVWHAIDETGTRVPAGVYFVRLQTDDYQKTQKAVLLR